MSRADAETNAQLAASVVQADTPAVRDVLRAMVQVVLDSGGSLHPGIRLVEQGGDMTVLCSGDGAEPPLFDVPRELLIPVTGATWAHDTSELRLIAPPPGLTPLQRDVLDLHIELYNAAGKIPWLVSHHPRAALADQPDLIGAIQALRPGYGREWLPPADTFLSTRVFGLTTPQGPGAPEPAKVSVLMTLIDLLNHHPKGAPYRVDERAMTPAIAHATGTEECFATYGGRRDVIDLALQYGFVDHHTTYARGAAVAIDVAGVGRVFVGKSVRAARPTTAESADQPTAARAAAAPRGPATSAQPAAAAPQRGESPAGLEASKQRPRPSPLEPPRVFRNEDGLFLSHITFDTRRPQAFHVPLRMAVQGAALQAGMTPAAAARAADQAADALVQANLDLLAGIAAAAAAAEAAAHADGTSPAVAGTMGPTLDGPSRPHLAYEHAPVLALMAAAAQRQAELIRAVAAAR